MPRTLFHTVTHATDRTTVEDVLRNRMNAGRAAIARAKHAKNGITLDGQRVRVTNPVYVGQTVGLLIDDEALGCADTSGLVVFAKNAFSQDRLQEPGL